MPAALDELVDRLAARLWQLASAKIITRVELEVARMQAELLEQAAAFRRGHGKIGEQVARRLETVSERLVQELLADQAEVEAATRLWPTGTSTRVDDTPTIPLPEADPGKRPRGRPRKTTVGDGLSRPTPAGDVTTTTLDEVTNEERIHAHDPSGTDQVRDLSAEDVQR